MLKISAVVPAYNAERYIEATLQSLAKQTYPLCEIIVTDDKSTDSTIQVVEKFRESTNISIKIICQEVNHGVSAARNHGITAATGDWILFMDADDIANEGLLKTEVDHLLDLQSKTIDNWVVVYPAYSQINENGQSISGIMRGIEMTSRNALGCEFVRNQLITPSGVIVNKAAINAVGGFRIGLKHQVEDWDLWLKLARNGGGFAYVDKPLVEVRRHTTNATRSMSKALEAEKEVFAFYEIADIKEAIFSRDESLLKNLMDYVQVLFKIDEWDLGYQELNKVEDNTCTSILFLKGLYCLKENLVLEAREYLEQAVTSNVSNGAALNNLGAVYGAMGNVVVAQLCLQEALRRFPGYMDAQNNVKLLADKERHQLADFHITWRELRPVLLNYSE